jgi:hypothetical protein
MRSPLLKSSLALAVVCLSLLAPSQSAAQQPGLQPQPTDPIPPAGGTAPVPPPGYPAPGYPPAPPPEEAPAYPPPALPPPPEAPPPESGANLETGNETQPAEGADTDKKKKKKRKDGGGASNGDGGSNVRSNYGIGEIRLGGWIFARGDLQRLERTTVNSMGSPVTRDINTLDLSVPSARFRIDYQSPWEWLTGQIEVDLAGNPDLRDGYVQARGENVAFRMGQFKMPVLAMQMESPWVLPLVRRGLIHDLTVDWLDVAGRLPGAMITLREKFGRIKPRLMLGAFQARTFVEINADLTRDTDLVRERSLSSQKLVARGQVDVGSVEIGASYEHRLGSPGFGQLRRFWTAGADVTVNHVFATSGLRIWADALAGASWYEHPAKPVDTEDATFIAGRVLVAYRFGGVVPEAFYVEPYLFGGVFDPDIDVTSDMAWEATAGVNVGFFGRARATLQAEMDEGQRNFPIGYLAGVTPDRLALIAQLGLAY